METERNIVRRTEIQKDRNKAGKKDKKKKHKKFKRNIIFKKCK